MVKDLTIEESYDICLSEGNFIPQANIDNNKINSMLKIIEEDIQTIEELKKTNRYNTLLKLTYDVLHTLAEIILLFDKIKSSNHKCLFTYICTKHKELEFDWNFFEKFRTKRNGIHYYGTTINKDEWKELLFGANLYINTLKEYIKLKQKTNKQN